MKNQFVCFLGRSLIVKKNDGIKESTDSQATIDDEDTRGRCQKGLKKKKLGLPTVFQDLLNCCSREKLNEN